MENSLVPLQKTSLSLLSAVRLVATDMDGTLTQQGQFVPGLLRSLLALNEVGIQSLLVTGRSAGWVQGLVAYLPVIGAIAENGGVFIPKTTLEPCLLVNIADLSQQRDHLAAMFAQLQMAFPKLQPATDNQFRITDWTFDIDSLTPKELDSIAATCQTAGWGFTYSTVQCHIRPLEQNKGNGLQKVLQQYLPDCSLSTVLTVGDSPNDESLFDPDYFPLSVGVANITHYHDRLHYFPKFVTQKAEYSGFQELVEHLIKAQH